MSMRISFILGGVLVFTLWLCVQIHFAHSHNSQPKHIQQKKRKLVRCRHTNSFHQEVILCLREKKRANFVGNIDIPKHKEFISIGQHQTQVDFCNFRQKNVDKEKQPPANALLYIPNKRKGKWGARIYHFGLDMRNNLLLIQRVTQTELYTISRGIINRPTKVLKGKYALSKNGRFLIGGEKGSYKLQFFDVEMGKFSREMKTYTANWIVACSPKMDYVASGSYMKNVELVNLKTGKTRRLNGHRSHETKCLGFSGDGRLLALGDEASGYVRIWDTKTAQVYRDFEIPKSPTTVDYVTTWNTVFSSDGDLLLTATTHGVFLWHVNSRQLLSKDWHLPSEFGALSPDGRLLAVQNLKNRTLDLREVATGGSVIRIHFGPFRSLRPLGFSKDGRFLCGESRNNDILIWDLLGLGDLKRDSKKPKLNAKELWENLLAQNKPTTSYLAVRSLAKSPNLTIPFLRQILKPAPIGTSKTVNKLLDQLGSHQEPEREKSYQTLYKMGSNIKPLLQLAISKNELAKSHEAVQKLLNTLPPSPVTTEELQQIRAIHALQWAGGKDIHTLLKQLATGDPAVRQTYEAKLALRHMVRPN